MSDFTPVIELLSKKNDFLITAHVNPDGDAVGSLLGLGLLLRSIGKEVVLALAQPVPSTYLFLPGSDQVCLPQNLPREAYDVGVVLDCSELERAGEALQKTLKNCRVLVNIDHHLSNKRFGDLNLVDSEAAATGEIICELAEKMGVKISPEVATNLYAALVTDTGSFQFANTTPRSHYTAARLLEYGAERQRIREFLYEQRSLRSLRLLEKALGTLCLNSSGRIAWMKIRREFFLETGAGPEDCEGFIEYPKSLAGVELGVLFKEIEQGEVKVGFRSKNLLDVSKLAAFFGGGGHERAAGCVLKGELDKVEKLVIATAEEFLARFEGRNQ